MRARLWHAAAGFLLRGSRVDELLNALYHAATFVTLQVVQLICCRLGSAYVLLGHGVDWAVGPQHAGNSGTMLFDSAQAARPASSRRAAGGTIYLALIGLGEASHGG